jgi:hypothetical protein
LNRVVISTLVCTGFVSYIGKYIWCHQVLIITYFEFETRMNVK